MKKENIWLGIVIVAVIIWIYLLIPAHGQTNREDLTNVVFWHDQPQAVIKQDAAQFSQWWTAGGAIIAWRWLKYEVPMVWSWYGIMGGWRGVLRYLRFGNNPPLTPDPKEVAAFIKAGATPDNALKTAQIIPPTTQA